MEKDLSPNEAVSHSRFPRPWGLPEQGANLCGVCASHVPGGSAPGIWECLPGKEVTSGSKSFLPGRKQPGDTSVSVLEQQKNLLNALQGTHKERFVRCRAGVVTASSGDGMDGWTEGCVPRGEGERCLLPRQQLVRRSLGCSVSAHTWPVGKREPSSSPCQWHLVDF